MSNKDFKVPLLQLVSTISNAVDLVSPVLNNHHKQVAYISYKIARTMGFPDRRLNDLVIASLLHDIGALTLRDRIDVMEFEEKNPYSHTISGYVLLKDLEIFKRPAQIIKHHHLPWQGGKGKEFRGDTVLLESHILYLADRVSVSINHREHPLTQSMSISNLIKNQSNKKFHPDFVDAFGKVSIKEAFWLDLVSPSIDNRLEEIWNNCNIELNLQELLEVTRIIGRIIDFRSRFTSIHSSGVTAVAEIIAKKMNWSDEGCIKMQIAGYLHDLGKLIIPNEILEKPDKLTKDEFNIMKTHTYHGYYLLDNVKGLEEINEYASFHHERIDGSGYPFKIGGEDLKEGSRIMSIADVFTAITEDRPYRKGMKEDRAIEILERMGRELVLDSKIIQVVRENFDEVNNVRRKAQQQASERYEEFEREIHRTRKFYC